MPRRPQHNPDEVPPCRDDGVPMPFKEGALHVNGSDFTLLPVKGVHTERDVRLAKAWLRGERDVVTLIVRWREQQ